MAEKEAITILRLLTPRERTQALAEAERMARNAGVPLQGAGFFSFLKKAGKGLLKVGAPIAISLATKALEKKIMGKGVSLAGRGQKKKRKLPARNAKGQFKKK